MTVSDIPESKAGLKSGSPSLEALLRRKDVWRGHSQAFVGQKAWDTGHDVLNALLLQRGWPESNLIELGQKHLAGTWFLLAPAASSLIGMAEACRGVLVLLNPPAEPYAEGLSQAGFVLDRVLLVQTRSKNDFLASFLELARSPACQMLMAWQPRQRLSYAELRKCQLAVQEQAGLYFLLRHHSALSQSSPASLRLNMHVEARSLQVELIKQRGKLPGAAVHIPLPDAWFSTGAYAGLMQSSDTPLYQQANATPWLSNNVLSLRPASGRAEKPSRG